MDKGKTFNEALQAIRDSEQDVDRVLRAARLQRCEKQRMSEDMVFALAVLGVIALGMVLFAAMEILGV